MPPFSWSSQTRDPASRELCEQGVYTNVARGTSLLVMIPTGIAGTVTNLRHRMVDLRVGLVVGVSAAAATPVGRLVATWVSPSVGAILFNIFLLSIIASTILKMRKKARAQR